MAVSKGAKAVTGSLGILNVGAGDTKLTFDCRHAASLNRHHEAALLSYQLAECAIRMARTLRLQGKKK